MRRWVVFGNAHPHATTRLAASCRVPPGMENSPATEGRATGDHSRSSATDVMFKPRAPPHRKNSHLPSVFSALLLRTSHKTRSIFTLLSY